MHSEKMFRQFKNQIIWTTESSAVLVVWVIMLDCLHNLLKSKYKSVTVTPVLRMGQIWNFTQLEYKLEYFRNFE